ncbi:MAG: P1 family peptidase [Rubrobacteraceae bacterium]
MTSEIVSDKGRLTDVPGLTVGHAQDPEGITGCTVVLCGEEGFTGGADVRGGGPATRETDALHPDCLVNRVHAVTLCGGSAFGLAAAQGVVEHLKNEGVGIDTHIARVPIVCAAAMFDLPVGEPYAYPTPEMGQRAAGAARVDFEEGSVGAGLGATVGKFAGLERATKAGVGTASITVGDLVVGAIVSINAFGQVVNEDRSVLDGARGADGGWLDVQEVLRSNPPEARPIENTSLAVVGTNARLTKAQAKRVAMMAHDGLARSIYPIHTMFDGDSVFALASGEVEAEPSMVGTWAADIVAEATRRSVILATGTGGIPAIGEIRGPS